MSESPVSDRTGEERIESLAELPLGVRAADFLLKNSFLLLALTIGGAFLALSFAQFVPRLYVDSAVVEVGMRAANEPLENPIQAGWRLRGALLDTARDLGVELDSTIVHRREEKTNELTRFMDITVSAETASTARTILDRGLARLIAEHQEAHAVEKEILREQTASLESAAAHLEKSLREEPTAEALSEREITRQRTQLDALNARLFELYRAIHTARSLISDVRTPPTRVVGRVAKVEPAPSHALIFALAGAMFGGLLGLALAGARLVAREGENANDGPNADPIVKNFLSITRRYRLLILSVAGVITVAGVTAGFLHPPSYHGISIVAAARIEPDGTIVDFHTVDAQLETHVQRLVVGDQLSEDTELEAMVLRDQPPTSKKLPMVSLHARSPHVVSVRRALDRALAHLRSLEGPAYTAERQRLERAVHDMDTEVQRLLEGPVTPKTQEALQKAIGERSEAKRKLSPVRTYPSRVLAMMPVEQIRKETRVLAFGMLALVAGVSAGYVLAFFLFAVRSLRELEQRKTA